MIRGIKKKFLLLSMAALFVLLAAIITGMNLVNYNSIISDADTTLSLLSKNHGRFPEFGEGDASRHMNPETPYESRYFSVLLDQNDNVIQTDTSRIKAIDSGDAIDYAESVLQNSAEKGFAGKYRFLRCEEDHSTRIVFLDCGRKFDAFRDFLLASIFMAVCGYLVFFFVLLFFSSRIVRPVLESYEKQKQFITDAGHEIKTPLAIIQADVDVLEMDIGANEWLEDIQKQTGRLAALTNDLVYLSRMEESADRMQMIEFPFSEVVAETATSFQALAQTQEKEFRCDIQPMLSFVGDEKAIRQLVCILLDNAMKYSPAHGSVLLCVQKQGRQIRLSVRNAVETPMPRERLHLLFERFYRVDSSRSSKTGGYGIGLSVARAIVTAHNGKITANATEGPSLEIVAQFPQ